MSINGGVQSYFPTTANRVTKLQHDMSMSDNSTLGVSQENEEDEEKRELVYGVANLSVSTEDSS